MQSGNNIHEQQCKKNMINEEWNKTQNDAPFVAYYEMVDVLIAGLQFFFFLYPD